MISGRSGGGRNTGKQVGQFSGSRLADKIFKSALAIVSLSFLSFIDLGCKKREAKKDFSAEPKILIKDFVPSPHIISPKNRDGKFDEHKIRLSVVVNSDRIEDKSSVYVSGLAVYKDAQGNKVKSILTKTILTNSLIRNLYRRYEHYLKPNEDLDTYHIQILWDGKDEKGDFVQDGRFYFTVFASLINEKIEWELKEEQRKILDDIIKVLVAIGSKSAKIEITKSFSVSGAKISAELPEKKVEFEINQKKDSEYEIKGEVVSQELLESLKNLLSSLSAESKIRVDIIESVEYPQYGEVAVDNTPPVSIVFVGDPKYESGSDVFVTPKTPIKIFIQDNIAGSDGASVFVDLGAEQIYLGKLNEFMLELPDGKYALLYRAGR
jgi:hypothetical protein